MSGQPHFAIATGWLLLGIAGLLWVMAGAIAANKMEREGIAFWKALLTCLVLTPLVGLIVLGVSRSMRPHRSLVQTATRS